MRQEPVEDREIRSSHLPCQQLRNDIFGVSWFNPGLGGGRGGTSLSWHWERASIRYHVFPPVWEPLLEGQVQEGSQGYLRPSLTGNDLLSLEVCSNLPSWGIRWPQEEMWLQCHRPDNILEDVTFILLKRNSRRHVQHQKPGGKWAVFSLPNATVSK